MKFRHAVGLCLVFFLVVSVSAQAPDPSRYIFRTFNARFHCGGKWYDFQLTISPATGPLGTLDPDAGIVAQINVMFYRSLTRMDPAAYMLTGPYDKKTGHFRLEPKQWNFGTPPSGFEMVGMEGKFDPATETIAAKMLGSACDSVGRPPSAPSRRVIISAFPWPSWATRWSSGLPSRTAARRA